MNKQILIAALLLITGAFFIINHKKKPKKQYQIGILQTASHPALDGAYQGFKEELQKLSNDQVDFAFYNGQGSITTIHTLAQKLGSSQADAFYAIATPAAQALHAVDRNRPLAIAAVTDPEDLGLDYPGTPVCGATDMLDIEKTANMILAFIPEAQNIGLLYTSGEANSKSAALQMRKVFEQRNKTVTDFAANSEMDLATVAETAFRKSDVVLSPTDNIVATSISMLSKIALNAKKPFFVGDNTLVTYGPLAARGIDYQQCGRQAAEILYAVLTHTKSEKNAPIVQGKCDAMYVNENTLQVLNITVPKSLQSNVILVK